MQLSSYNCSSNSNFSTNAISSLIVSLEKSKRIPAASYTFIDCELPSDNAFYNFLVLAWDPLYIVYTFVMHQVGRSHIQYNKMVLQKYGVQVTNSLLSSFRSHQYV